MSRKERTRRYGALSIAGGITTLLILLATGLMPLTANAQPVPNPTPTDNPCIDGQHVSNPHCTDAPTPTQSTSTTALPTFPSPTFSSGGGGGLVTSPGGPSPSPRSVESHIYIHYRHHIANRFRGTVTSSEQACRPGRAVSLYQLDSNGVGQLMATTTSDTNGKWIIPQDAKPYETWYSTVSEAVITVDGVQVTCGAAQSRSFKINRGNDAPHPSPVPNGD